MADKDDPIFVPEEGIENREAVRVDARFEIEYSGRSVSGTGVVRNISATGAFISDARPPLPSGGEIKLSFSLYEGATPVTVRAIVARETAEGFAVQFLEMDVRTRKILKTTLAKARRAGEGETPLHRPDPEEASD